MPISREKKATMLEKLKKVVSAKALAFVNFHGLTVAEVSELRRKLSESGVKYIVAKKTLTKKALGEAGIGGTMPELPGELAVAYSEDLTAPAREIYAFQKKFEKRVTLTGGVFEGAFIGMEEAKAVALIPSMQTLRAQFVNVINSPIQGLVMALNQIAEKRAKAQ